MQKIISASIFAASATYLVLLYFFSLSLPTWLTLVFAVLCIVGLFSTFYFREASRTDLENELRRFQKEFKTALRGHLKVSILFWSHYYMKEKVKSYEEAKKEVFQDLKKEFSDLHWMETLLEDIRRELSKYK